MNVVDKKTRERFEIVCTTGQYIFLVKLKQIAGTREIIAVGQLQFPRQYEAE